MIFRAIQFATQAHDGQFRKGTRIPYITHPLNVARLLIECDCPEPVIAAGILHDTLEDTHVTLDDLRGVFGNEAADLVSAVSEPNKSDHTWENRKAHTLKHLRTASPEVLIIALADKLDNIRAIREDLEKVGDRLWKRFNRPKEKQRWYYGALADVFSSRLNDPKVLRLVNDFNSEVQRVFGGRMSFQANDDIRH
jgi:(p)ppGpp synthase/HD superfamily hydrolase